MKRKFTSNRLAAALACGALVSAATAQVVRPDPNGHAAPRASEVAASDVRPVRAAAGWVLERVEPVGPAAAVRSAAGTDAAESRANLRAVSAAGGVMVLEQADAPAVTPSAVPDGRRVTVRANAAGQKMLEMADDARAAAAKATVPAAGMRIVDLPRTGGTVRLPTSPEPMVLYRVVD